MFMKCANINLDGDKDVLYQNSFEKSKNIVMCGKAVYSVPELLNLKTQIQGPSLQVSDYVSIYCV
jgi:hypothetical protein